MIAVITVIHLLIVLALIGVVLMQRSEGGALGIGGGGGGAGGGGGFLSGRGTANLLTRTTAILAACFMATAIVLTILSGVDRDAPSLLDNLGGEQMQPLAPLEPSGDAGGTTSSEPSAPSVPVQ
jgi:preprotein translocase subunit SecG